MIYIKEYSEYKSYEEIGESNFLNQDSLHDYDNPRIEVGYFQIEKITKFNEKKLYELLHKSNFYKQWFKYINISIVNFNPCRFMVKSPEDVKDKSLFIVIKPELDINHKDWTKLGNITFHIEVFLVDDDYYYARVTSVYPPMNRSTQAGVIPFMMHKDIPTTKYFKCDQIEGLVDCLSEELPNWYPGLKK